MLSFKTARPGAGGSKLPLVIAGACLFLLFGAVRPAAGLDPLSDKPARPVITEELLFEEQRRIAAVKKVLKTARKTVRRSRGALDRAIDAKRLAALHPPHEYMYDLIRAESALEAAGNALRRGAFEKAQNEQMLHEARSELRYLAAQGIENDLSGKISKLAASLAQSSARLAGLEEDMSAARERLAAVRRAEAHATAARNAWHDAQIDKAAAALNADTATVHDLETELETARVWAGRTHAAAIAAWKRELAAWNAERSVRHHLKDAFTRGLCRREAVPLKFRSPSGAEQTAAAIARKVQPLFPSDKPFEEYLTAAFGPLVSGRTLSLLHGLAPNATAGACYRHSPAEPVVLSMPFLIGDRRLTADSPLDGLPGRVLWLDIEIRDAGWFSAGSDVRIAVRGDVFADLCRALYDALGVDSELVPVAPFLSNLDITDDVLTALSSVITEALQ